MHGHIYFEIHAAYIRRAADFYGAVFGWQFEKAQGLPVEYWRIVTGGTRGGLIKRPAARPAQGLGANAFVCSVEVEDFDATAKRIAAAGGRVALEKFAIPRTCWQGYFIDTEGNTFGIFEVDEGAG
jgi:predicted enzyme related to lactoylglutathione lyase